ncbi:Pkinase-domain-containing protein [Wallemia mellicola]|uniref:non-specific serine/threonine protein kinase n=1 Tax=Wallemia mellicola TaxID=1708541 RepID=A0A4T0TR11_9BASI|nr:Pkinase-domain-containing protein [Wallemia mellicola]TIC67494.1 Pkinase-domain-containing protein [Wallemia mellicola]
MEVPGLQNYQIGDCLGKGAFGSVYRALNWSTGETVAVKQIQLSDIPKSHLGDIMSEIDLLKNLHHPRIVRYGGFVKTKDALYSKLSLLIDLQYLIKFRYCENGSLASISKRFGKFPEPLVAVYISQVLEGLQYLHDQGVCHRDIKAANILAIKDGSVKLADFGVATQAHLADNSVVGSPFWMAPEVIEQSGASTASDIWSVGCVVIELLEGRPPYSHLPQMSALWAIVQNDQMPIPEGSSPVVKDFLLHCFQKDSNLRITAKKLLKHPWMRQFDTNQSVGKPNSKQSILYKNNTPIKEHETYDVAVQKVQEWNEALKSPPKSSKTQAALFPVRDGKNTFSPLRRTSLNNGSPYALTSANQQTGKPFTVRNDKRENVLSKTQEDEEDNWDDDFAGTITFSKGQDFGTTDFGKPPSDDNTQTIKVNSAQTSQELAKEPVSMTKSVEDYSDLGGDEDDQVLNEKISSLKLKGGLFHPNDLNKLKEEPVSPKQTLLTIPQKKQILPKRPSPPPSLRSHSRSQSNTSSSAITSIEQERKASDLAKYSEADDENFDDVFGKAPPLTPGESGQTLQLTTKLSNKSWLGDDFPDDEDPFAQIEDDFAENDLESNLIRDRHARLCVMVNDLVNQLEAGQNDDQLNEVIDKLLNILGEFPDMHAQFVIARGMLSTLEVLESKPAKDVIYKLLRIINLIVSFDPSLVESFCLVGGIAVVMTYASKRYSHELRLEAATFVAHVTHTSVLTLQMFIACRGFKVLVELLDEEAQELVYEAVSAISSVFESHTLTTKTDFCRIFAKEGLLEPLSEALTSALKDNSDEATEVIDLSSKICLLFAQVGQNDSVVLNALGTRSILRRLLKACESLCESKNMSGLLITLLKTFKHISTSAGMLDVLQNSNAIDVFVRVLDKCKEGERSSEISSQVLQIFFSLTRLSPSRQEEAAQAGLIPLMKRVYEVSSPLKQFALPMLCDFAHAGKSCRALLWRHNCLELYILLLQDPYFQVSALEAILVWLQNETDRVESMLINPKSLDILLSMFIQAKANMFESLLEPLLKTCRISKGVVLGIAKSAFFKKLIEKLSHHKALVRLNLLRILRVVLEIHPECKFIVQHYRIAETITRLAATDSAILVRELSKEIANELREGKFLSTPTFQRRSTSDNSILPVGRSYRPQKRIPSRGF